MWLVILNICGMLWLMSMMESFWLCMWWISFSIILFFLMFSVVVGLFMMIIWCVKVVVCVMVMYCCWLFESVFIGCVMEWMLIFSLFIWVMFCVSIFFLLSMCSRLLSGFLWWIFWLRKRFLVIVIVGVMVRFW